MWGCKMLDLGHNGDAVHHTVFEKPLCQPGSCYFRLHLARVDRRKSVWLTEMDRQEDETQTCCVRN